MWLWGWNPELCACKANILRNPATPSTLLEFLCLFSCGWLHYLIIISVFFCSVPQAEANEPQGDKNG